MAGGARACACRRRKQAVMQTISADRATKHCLRPHAGRRYASKAQAGMARHGGAERQQRRTIQNTCPGRPQKANDMNI
eukprot:3300827-Alexandrium_andersonii.AAC.1